MVIIVLSIRLFGRTNESEVFITEDTEEVDKPNKWTKIDAQNITDNPITLAKDGWFALAAGKDVEMQ